jgi:hypothetical protein
MDKTRYEKKKETIQKLEKLVGRRFETITKLENYLTEYLASDKPIKLDFAYQNYESDHTADWNLIANCENEFVFCDFDVYFLYDRYDNLHITEIGYEFE